jgi:prefoldin subunit 5
LEFEPYDVYPDRKTGEFSESTVAEAWAFLATRRKKVKVFREAMNRYCDAVEKAYDEYEKALDKVSIAQPEE